MSMTVCSLKSNGSVVTLHTSNSSNVRTVRTGRCVVIMLPTCTRDVYHTYLHNVNRKSMVKDVICKLSNQK